MKTRKSLSELFEQARNEAPEAPVSKILSLVENGKASPLSTKHSLRPRRIKLFMNPLKFLVMIAPIVLISGLLLFVHQKPENKPDIQNVAEIPVVQAVDNTQFMAKKPAKPVEVLQGMSKAYPEARNEGKQANDAGLLKKEPVIPPDKLSEVQGIKSTKEVSQDSKSLERNSEQKILRVNIDFLKSMGVEALDNLISVYTKNAPVSLRDHASSLTRHIFQKGSVTSYANWTDTIWQIGEELPTLVAVTNVFGLYSYKFSKEFLSPHFIQGAANNSRFEMCVAVSLDMRDTLSVLYGTVFWFYPNEKFFKCLPKDIAGPLKKEFNYQSWRLDSTFVPRIGGSIGIGGGGLQKDSGDLKNEPVPCVYFTNLCESLPGLDYVNLYPNPATDKLNVDLVLQMAKNIRFRVFDLGGRVISDEESPQNYPEGGQCKHQLDISNLQAGLYLLVMTDDEGARLTRRFVKN